MYSIMRVRNVSDYSYKYTSMHVHGIHGRATIFARRAPAARIRSQPVPLACHRHRRSSLPAPRTSPRTPGARSATLSLRPPRSVAALGRLALLAGSCPHAGRAQRDAVAPPAPLRCRARSVAAVGRVCAARRCRSALPASLRPSVVSPCCPHAGGAQRDAVAPPSVAAMPPLRFSCVVQSQLLTPQFSRQRPARHCSRASLQCMSSCRSPRAVVPCLYLNKLLNRSSS